ncbi:MAG: SOS response-associated peptidase [Nitrospira sp.]|nr:SOS response-associated peptidase [Nitrospira sp.]
MKAPWAKDQIFTPNHNIRPTSLIPAVRLTEDGPVAGNYLWGFLPQRAPSRDFVREWSTFNARDDNLTKSRLYSQPFRESRSLVVVSAWFEWPGERGKKKTLPPCTITPADQGFFVMAGVWGSWKDPETGTYHDTTTMITTEPNEAIADLPHHRMPALLPPSAWEAWLNPDTPVGVLQDMLHPTPDEWLEIAVGGPKDFQVE